MSTVNKEKVSKLQLALFIGAIIFNIWGILSIVHVNAWADIGLKYLDAIDHIFFKYVIIVVTMAIGIMSFSITSGTLKGPKMRPLLIGVTAYSTVLTVPLLMAFICFIITFAGTTLPAFLDEMFGVIAWDIYDLLGNNNTLTYIAYIAGVLMSIVFLGFPILSAYLTLKKADKKAASANTNA